MIRFVMKHTGFVSVLLAGAMLLGVVGYVTTPRFEDPPMIGEGGILTILYPGASPEELEDKILDDLDETLFNMKEVKEVKTRVYNGGSVSLVKFHEGQDFEDAFDRVEAKFNASAQQFPTGVTYTEAMHFKTNDVVILQLALFSDRADNHGLRLLAKGLKDRLQVVANVEEVELFGEQEQEVRVSVDPDRLSAWDISLLAVVKAVHAEDEDHPGGRIQSSDRELYVQTTGEFETLEDIRGTVVAVRQGRTIRVRDVATVLFSDKDPSYKARFNGRPCLFLTVKAQFDKDALQVSRRVKEVVAAFVERQGGELDVQPVFDQSAHIRKRVRSFNWNLLLGAAIVNALICVVMGVRPALVVSAALPVSVLMALAVLPMTGLGIQQMVIVGLIICMGLLVDNSIVVVEMILQRRLAGEPILSAVVQAIESVGPAITSSTLTTIAAFIPIMVLPGGAGRFTRGIPVMVVLTLLASLLVAMTLIPLLSRVVFGPRQPIRLAPVARFVDAVVVPYVYGPVLRWSMRHRAVCLICVASLCTSMGIVFPKVGFQFFPHAEKPFLLVDLRMPDGTSLNATETAAVKLEKMLLGLEKTVSVATNVGHGNPMIYYNMTSKPDNVSQANLLVHVDGRLSAPEVDAFAESIREKTAIWGEREVQVHTIQQGPPVEADVIVRLTGGTWERLDEQIRRVERRIRNLPQVINVTRQLRRGAADLDLVINEEKAHRLGINSSEIGLTVRTALAGTEATVYRRHGETYPVVVRLPSSGQHDVSVLDRIYIPVRSGAAPSGTSTAATTQEIPLGQVVTSKLTGKWTQLQRRDTERVAEVNLDAAAGYFVDDAEAAVKEALADIKLPPGMRLTLAGENEERDESFGNMARGVLIGMIVIFAILVWQFQSVVQPIVAFSSMALSVSGGTLALYLTGLPFGFMPFMGVASLAGIVVNDAIVLVDRINQERRWGTGKEAAILAASGSRFLPVILTTITTVGGLLPLALMGGLTFSGMAWVIIGGLSSATILTLVVVPVLYSLMVGQLSTGREIDAIPRYGTAASPEAVGA